MILLVMFQCFVAKVLIIDIYSLTSEKQNITLVLSTLSAAMCNETMCLYCWTEFLTGALVHCHPYCLCVDLSARKSLEAGKWFQSNCKGSQLTRFQLGFQFTRVLCRLLAPCHQAQGCITVPNAGTCSAAVSTSHLLPSAVTAAKVVRMSIVFP